ncbi:unnamed protein product, partial [Arabidopsis halleri]
MVAETRARALQNDADEGAIPAVSQETEETLGSKVDRMIRRTQVLEATVAEQNKKIDRNIADMFDMIRMIPTNHASSSGKQGMDRVFPGVSATPDSFDDSPDPYRGSRSGNQQQYSGMTRIGKMDFPRFDGDRTRDWLFKVEEFFSLDFTPSETKVKLAAIHFDGRASTWHQSLMQTPKGKQYLRDWEAYKLLIIERFEDVFEDPIAELKQLQETTAHPTPKTTTGNWNNVKTVSGGARKNFTNGKREQTYSQGSSQETTTITDNKRPARKYFSQEEMSARRAKGLCFLCDEKYTAYHYLKHRKTQVYMIEVEEELVDQEVITREESDSQQIDIDNSCSPQVSVSAVAGIADYRTMKVRGIHNKQVLFVLLDSGSTHNFMDPQTAERLGVCKKAAGLANVSVADGSKLKVHGLVEKFQWDFHGTPFTDDFLLIPLGGCDVVLGVQWLITLGGFTWNLKKLEMSFWWKNKKVLLHGIKQGSVREVKTLKIQKLQEGEAQISMICAWAVEPEEEGSISVVEGTTSIIEVSSAVVHLKQQFSDIFEAPTTLPPFRTNLNHKIPLKEGSDHVNQRPYRYAIYQKNEIDKIMEEL